MRIEHVAMYVNDLESAKQFLEKYLVAKSGDKYHNKNTGFQSYFLSFEDGARLESMTKPGMQDEKNGMSRTGFIHVAFSLGSEARVTKLTQQMKDDWYEVVRGPRVTGDGYFKSCVPGLEGNQIEVTV